MNTILKSHSFKGSLTFFALLLGSTAFGQTEASGGDTAFMFYMVVGLVFLVAILVLITAVFTLRVLNVVLNRELEKQAEEKGVELQPAPNVVSKFMQRLTDRAPVEKEKDILLDHDYDGIKELDNHLPPWWLYLFYFTIAFGVVYLLSYHVFDTLPLQEEEYQNELALAEEAKARLASTTPEETVDENSIEFVDNTTWIANGEKVYNMQCASCHAADGGGIVGPNLTDEYWLHGGGIKNVFKTVKYGVVQKGMIAWEGVISNQQMRDVSMYIMTLQGTTPANPKDPQGEIWVEEDKSGEEEESVEGEESDETDEDGEVGDEGGDNEMASEDQTADNA
jgi:cytochrome c oxidase cbb3-type subunit 3